MRAAIHTNLKLSHQREFALALKDGFEKHGVVAIVTSDKNANADFHICLGPYYALDENIGNEVLYLGKGYWGHPNQVSLHWLNREGKKIYAESNQSARSRPKLKPMKSSSKIIALLDQGEDASLYSDVAATYGFNDIDIRAHPSNNKQQEPLLDCLNKYGVAIGGKTNSLITAAVNGLVVYTTSTDSPVFLMSGDDNPDRDFWLNALSWHNWTFEEIRSGAAWAHLDNIRLQS